MIQPSLSLVIIRKGVGTYGAERGIANWRPELYWEKSTKLMSKDLAQLIIFKRGEDWVVGLPVAARAKENWIKHSFFSLRSEEAAFVHKFG